MDQGTLIDVPGAPDPPARRTTSKGIGAGDIVLVKSSRDAGLRFLGDTLAGAAGNDRRPAPGPAEEETA